MYSHSESVVIVYLYKSILMLSYLLTKMLFPLMFDSIKKVWTLNALFEPASTFPLPCANQTFLLFTDFVLFFLCFPWMNLISSFLSGCLEFWNSIIILCTLHLWFCFYSKFALIFSCLHGSFLFLSYLHLDSSSFCLQFCFSFLLFSWILIISLLIMSY